MISLPTTTPGWNAPVPQGPAPSSPGTTGEFEAMIAQIGQARPERTVAAEGPSQAQSSANRSMADDDQDQSALKGRSSPSRQSADLTNEASDGTADPAQRAKSASPTASHGSPMDQASDEADPADFRSIAQFLLRAAPAAAAGTGSPQAAPPGAPAHASRAKTAAASGTAHRVAPAPAAPSARPAPQLATLQDPEVRSTPGSPPAPSPTAQKQTGSPVPERTAGLAASTLPGSRQGDVAKPVLWGESERPVPARMAPARPEQALLGSVEVSRRETHFAPVRRPSSIDASAWRDALPKETSEAPKSDAAKPSFSAVAEQLGRALETARPEAEARLQQAIGQQTAALARSVAPLRIVELSLQPASLGNLVVTMRLSGSGLRISVSTSTREAADVLREDRKALKSLIEDAGYEADEILVTYRPPLATD